MQRPLTYAYFGYEGEAFSKAGTCCAASMICGGYLRCHPTTAGPCRSGRSGREKVEMPRRIEFTDSSAVVIIGSGAGGGTIAQEADPTRNQGCAAGGWKAAIDRDLLAGTRRGLRPVDLA